MRDKEVRSATPIPHPQGTQELSPHSQVHLYPLPHHSIATSLEQRKSWHHHGTATIKDTAIRRERKELIADDEVSLFDSCKQIALTRGMTLNVQHDLAIAIVLMNIITPCDNFPGWECLFPRTQPVDRRNMPAHVASIPSFNAICLLQVKSHSLLPL
jgi:hypothetical protein